MITFLISFIFFFFSLCIAQDPSTSTISSAEYNALYDFFYAMNGPNWVVLNGSPWSFDPSDDPCGWDGITCECASVEKQEEIQEIASNFHLEGFQMSETLTNSSLFLSYTDKFDDFFSSIKYNLKEYMELYEFSPLDFFIPSPLANDETVSLVFSIKNEYREYKRELERNFNREEVEKYRVLLMRYREKLRSKLYSMQLTSLRRENENKKKNFFTYNIEKNGQKSTFFNKFSTLSYPKQNFLDSSPCTITRIELVLHNVTGSIPQSFSDLTSLKRINLNHNRITSTFPSPFLSLPNLEVINLDHNLFHGNLPTELGQAGLYKNLSVFSINDNLFNGSIPAGLLQIPSLYMVALDDNLFRGDIKTLSLGVSSQLRYFSINNNFVSGLLQFNITNLTELQSFDVGNNFLYGRPFLLNKTSESSGESEPEEDDEEVDPDQDDEEIDPDDYYQMPVSLSLLNIQNNNFTGPLPFFLFNTNQITIEEINFSNNSFTGGLDSPYLNALTNLKGLKIAKNFLKGEIPSTLTENSPSLRTFQINLNRFSGEFPENLLFAPSLLNLDISYNLFTNDCEIFKFKNDSALKSLKISGNRFRGDLDEIELPFFLTTLMVDSAGLQGQIPMNIMKLKFLTTLSLSNNSLTGRIPPFDSLSFIEILNLNTNKFSGDVPEFLCDARFLYLLYLNRNIFGGSLPHCIGDLSKLNFLDASNSALTGSLPLSLGQLDSIQILNIYNNDFEGKIFEPTSENHLRNLGMIDIGSNAFTGSIPINLIKLSNLEFFTSSKNCFDTKLPDDICDATSLISLNMDGLHTAKKCTSKIFPYLFDSFVISNQDFYTYKNSTIPSCIFNMPHLNVLHLGGNNYYGELEQDLKLSPNLRDLYLAHNSLFGKIPSAIQRKEWAELDLSYNFFTGILDEDFSKSMPNSTISLKINRISGHLPDNFNYIHDIDVLEGNMYTCSPFSTNIPEEDPYYVIYSCGSNATNFSIYMWCIIMIVFLLGITGLLLYSTRQLRKMMREYKRLSIFRMIFYYNILAIYENIHLFCFGEEVNTEDYGASSLKSSFYDSRLNSIITIDDELNSIIEEEDVDFEGFDFKKFSNSLKDLDFAMQLDLEQKGKNFFLFSSSMWKASRLFDHIRIYSFYLTCFTLIFLLPLYVYITSYHSMFTVPYTWIISSTYLAGMISGVLLSLSFVLVIFLFFYYIYTTNFYEKNPKIPLNLVPRYDVDVDGIEQDNEDDYDEDDDRSGIDSGVKLVDLKARDSIDTIQIENEKVLAPYRVRSPCLVPPDRKYILTVILIISFFNFCFTLCSNVVYIFAYKTVSAKYLFMVQLSVSLFKLFWVEILWRSFPFIHRHIYFYQSWKRGESSFFNPPPLPDNLSYYNFHTKEITALSLNSLVNMVFIPFIAIFISSPDCFYHSFVAPPPSTSSHFNCTNIYSVALLARCQTLDRFIDSSSEYNVGFEYRYECSSNFIAYYTSVYVSMYITGGLILPMVKISLKFIYNWLIKKQKLYKKHNLPIPKLYPLFTYHIYRLLPYSLHNPTSFPTKHKIFQKHKFVVDLYMNIVLLFSFAIIYPPLSFIICFSIWTNSLLEQITLGDLLKKAYQRKYYWYFHRLHDECDGIWALWKECILMGIPITIGITFGFCIFDVIGDNFGWKAATGALIGFTILPVILRFLARSTSNFLTIFPSRKTNLIIDFNQVISPFLTKENSESKGLEQEKGIKRYRQEREEYNRLWLTDFFLKFLNVIKNKTYD